MISKPVVFRVLTLIAFVLLLCALAIASRHYGAMDWLVENETRMREWAQHNPIRVWAVGLLIYTALSMVPGTSGKSILFGWVFGFWQAVLIVDIALTLAATASFVFARYVLRDLINSRFKVRIERINQRLDQDGAFYLLLLRLAHVPFTFVNYATATTSVPLRTFVWTTMLGLLPATMVFVFVGTRIPTLSAISERGAWELLDPFLLAILGIAIVFPACVHWTIRHLERRRRRYRLAMSDPATDKPASRNTSRKDSSGRAAHGIR